MKVRLMESSKSLPSIVIVESPEILLSAIRWMRFQVVEVSELDFPANLLSSPTDGIKSASLGAWRVKIWGKQQPETKSARYQL